MDVPDADEEQPAEQAPRWSVMLEKDLEQMKNYLDAISHVEYLLSFDLDTSGVALVGGKETSPTVPEILGVGLLQRKLVGTSYFRSVSTALEKVGYALPVPPLLCAKM